MYLHFRRNDLFKSAIDVSFSVRLYDQANYTLHTPDIDSKSLTCINIKDMMLIHIEKYFGLREIFKGFYTR